MATIMTYYCSFHLWCSPDIHLQPELG